MTPNAGIFHRARVRLFGESDAVAAQLREIARQGASMAHLAHACAFALILLFSAGSLVALGGDALASILTGWQHGRVLDIPSAISVAVSTLLVMCMDVGMVYAASMLRLLATRRAEASERRVHAAVMVIVAALEAATYAYMSALRAPRRRRDMGADSGAGECGAAAQCLPQHGPAVAHHGARHALSSGACRRAWRDS